MIFYKLMKTKKSENYKKYIFDFKKKKKHIHRLIQYFLLDLFLF